MKRRNDLYITEYMLQASLQTKQKSSHAWKYFAVSVLLILVAAAVYALNTRSF